MHKPAASQPIPVPSAKSAAPNDLSGKQPDAVRPTSAVTDLPPASAPLTIAHSETMVASMSPPRMSAHSTKATERETPPVRPPRAIKLPLAQDNRDTVAAWPARLPAPNSAAAIHAVTYKANGMTTGQAKAYAQLLDKQCSEQELNALLSLHIQKVFEESPAATQAMSAQRMPSPNSRAVARLPNIDTDYDLAAILLFCSEPDNVFKILASRLQDTQIFHLYKIILHVAAALPKEDEHHISKIQRNRTIIIVMLEYFCESAKIELANLLTPPCHHFVKVIADDQAKHKTEMSEKCIKQTVVTLTQINETISDYLVNKARRILGLFHEIAIALQQDKTLSNEKLVDIILGTISISFIGDVIIKKISYSEPSVALPIIAKHLTKVLGFLLTGDLGKREAFEQFPDEFKKFLTDPAQKHNYLQFCQDVSTEQRAYIFPSKYRPIKFDASVIPPKRVQELYFWSFFVDIYEQFSKVKLKYDAAHLMAINHLLVTIGNLDDRLLQEKKLTPSAAANESQKEVSKALAEKLLEIFNAKNQKLFPPLKPPYQVGYVDELRRQLVHMPDIYPLSDDEKLLFKTLEAQLFNSEENLLSPREKRTMSPRGRASSYGIGISATVFQSPPQARPKSIALTDDVAGARKDPEDEAKVAKRASGKGLGAFLAGVVSPRAKADPPSDPNLISPPRKGAPGPGTN